MKKLAIALAASTLLGVTAVPAGAQGVYIGVGDGYGYRDWWGGPRYGYRSWWGGPRAYGYAYRDRPFYRHHRYYGGYGAYGYGHRSWWGGY